MVATEGGDGKDEMERLGGLGLGGGVGGLVCVRKRLISRKLLNQIQKMNMFWNQHELGYQPGVKKVKKVKE